MATLKPRRRPVEADASRAAAAAPMLKPDAGWLAALVDSSSGSALEFRPAGLHCAIELPPADSVLHSQMDDWLGERELGEVG